jgi:hypothetical protein
MAELRYDHRTCLKRLRKMTKNLIEYTRYPDRDSNQALSHYDPRLLALGQLFQLEYALLVCKTSYIHT